VKQAWIETIIACCRCADFVLLNKVDMLKAGEVEDLSQIAASLNPLAKVPLTALMHWSGLEWLFGSAPGCVFCLSQSCLSQSATDTGLSDWRPVAGVDMPLLRIHTDLCYTTFLCAMRSLGSDRIA